MRTNALILMPMILLVLAGNCLAQVPAVSSFSGGTGFVTIDLTSLTAGWTFTANADLTVSALGFWEPDTTVPLVQTHQVGLWTASGTLLSSATVQVDGSVTGSWRYVSITPVTLSAGHAYVVGSTLPAPATSNDQYTRVPVAGGSVVTSSTITVGTSAISATGSGFAFPSTGEALYRGRFGPNLMVTPIPPDPIVPISPWALAMMAVGLIAVGFKALSKGKPESGVAS